VSGGAPPDSTRKRTMGRIAFIKEAGEKLQ
jgi:hypothetical protein